MSDRKLRWLGLGLVATAGAGVLGLSAMMNPAFAHADDQTSGWSSAAPSCPSPAPITWRPLTGFTSTSSYPYPDLTFYQATSTDPATDSMGTGCSLPRGLIRCSAAASNSCITTTHSIPMAFRPSPPR